MPSPYRYTSHQELAAIILSGYRASPAQVKALVDELLRLVPPQTPSPRVSK